MSVNYVLIAQLENEMCTRPLGVDCGNPRCNSDHVRAEANGGQRLPCHDEACMIFLPSGSCTCEFTKPPVT